VAYTDALGQGGAEQALANLLAALDPSFEVSVLTVDEKVGERLRAARPGAELRVLRRVRDKWDVIGILEHIRAVRELCPDVFHANLWTTVAGQYGVLAGLLAPGACTVVVEQSPVPTSSDFQRLLKRASSRRVSAHVAVGERAARLVEEAVGLPPGSVRTIYNGVPDVPVEPLERVANGPVIGSLGRLSAEKGYDVAVRALALLPGTTLVLVGDGPEREALTRLARELGVEDRLQLVGWTDEPRRYLAGFDAFVLSSRVEGFPLAPVEAMLAGLPVVAADVGSVSEAVLDGETGFLFPAEDAEALAERVRRLLDDSELSSRLGRRGRELAVEQFTSQAMARAFEELYREILA
jgi:glycosyltransferase involved in cell wall biosynthesis